MEKVMEYKHIQRAKFRVLNTALLSEKMKLNK